MKWTQAEIDILLENHGRKTHAQIAAMLPGRTEGAVRNKCWRLGYVDSRAWTAGELELLRRHYTDGGTDGSVHLGALEKKLGRHRTNICAKARVLGLGTTYNRHKTAEHAAIVSESMREWHKAHEHPRGFLGRHHSEEARRATSRSSSTMWADPEAYVNSEEYRQAQSDRMKEANHGFKPGQHAYSRAKGGIRPDLGIFVRSSWEANYARYLNWLIEVGEIRGWEYEPETFEFEGIKRGTRTYTPDFKVTNLDGSVEYHEVKGWMDPKSKTKLKRMAKYHPGIKLVLIDKDVYYAIRRECKNLVPDWE